MFLSHLLSWHLQSFCTTLILLADFKQLPPQKSALSFWRFDEKSDAKS